MTPETITATARAIHADTAALRDLADREGPAYETAYMVGQTAERIAKEAIALAGGEYRPEYNGHPNRETWNAALWIGNDEGAYNLAREIVADAFRDYEEPALLAEIRSSEPPEERAASRRLGALRDAGDALREWFEEEYGPEDIGTPLGDAWTYAIACVDWPDVADGFAEGLEPGADDEEEDDGAVLVAGVLYDVETLEELPEPR